MLQSAYEEAKERLRSAPRRWLVTGVAGFIGSNLLEALLKLGQQVSGLDNFATGHRRNLEEVRSSVGSEAWERYVHIDGDIRDVDACRRACADMDVVLHQAALGSVPRSIENPLATHDVNCTGMLNMLVAARDAGVDRFVYAASSSAYGDHAGLPKVEDTVGRPLSPYAATKRANELYADAFTRSYGIRQVGLRYFNIFGPRQDPNGAYAAVIPRWIGELIRREQVYINGDGSTSRDFCYVENAVQANLLAATTENPDALNEVFNIAVSERTSLTRLFELQKTLLTPRFPWVALAAPQYRGFREGDVRHSLADISKARSLLDYDPAYRVEEGLQRTVDHYAFRFASAVH